MTSITKLLQDIKLTTQKNKDSITYTEVFEELGIETIEDISDNITSKEEFIEYINPKPIHLKKILKHLENKYNIRINPTEENKEDENQSTCDTKEKSLKITKQVLKQGEKLVLIVQSLYQKISQGTDKMRALCDLEQQLELLVDQIVQTKGFEYEEVQHYVERVPVPNGTYTTYCTSCHQTCHKYCDISSDCDIRGCRAMTNGYCHVCSGGCHWSAHHNYKYWLVNKTRKVVRKSHELFEKYSKTSNKASQINDLIEKIEEELSITKVEVLKLIEEVTICNDNSIPQKDYIKLIIEAERRDKKDGFIERIKSLESLLNSLDLIDNIQNNEDFKKIKVFDMNNSRQRRKHKSNKIKESLKRATQKTDFN